MKQTVLSNVAAVLVMVAAIAPAKAATVEIGFDQLSAVYLSNTYATAMATGRYFGFGSFINGFDPSTATLSQANILSVLRDNSKWFKSFETGYEASDDTSYTISSATAGTANGQYAFVIYINDTLANVQTALLGSAAGISTEFGVFTYTNTNASLRADLPRDPADFPADSTNFSTEFGLGTGLNNFTAVTGLGEVSGSGIALIPEPATGSLFLLGASLLFLRRKIIF
jgi:hypothetical protein